MVNIRRFESLDLPILHEWLSLRGVDVKDEDIAPYGWIAFVKDEPIGVAFLRRTDHIAYLEGMTTNPNQSSRNRHLAMDSLTVTIIDWAKEVGIKSLIAYTVNEGIIERANKWGFRNTPHTLMVLNLGG